MFKSEMCTISILRSCLAEHMLNFKMSIWLKLSHIFNKHFQTNVNTKKKSITNWYQRKFPSKNVISFTVKSFGCLEILPGNSLKLCFFGSDFQRRNIASIDKMYELPWSKILPLKALLFPLYIAASKYSLKFPLSILNIFNVCYYSNKTKLQRWKQSVILACCVTSYMPAS